METAVIVVMGVAGSGKTTVGRLLATELGWAFYDADDFHAASNIAKMAAGIPLTDSDRAPWLETLHGLIRGLLQRGEPAVLACSALKAAYRALLARDNPGLHFVYLKGSPDLIRRRLQGRRHFMKAGMLESQFAALEEPADALVVDAARTPAEIASDIKRALGV